MLKKRDVDGEEIVRRHNARQTIQAISETLGVSIGTVRTRLQRHHKSGPVSDARRLTVWELELLTLIADGHPVKEITRKTGKTVYTGDNTKAQMFAKLGARYSPHAVSIAYQLGYLKVT